MSDRQTTAEDARAWIQGYLRAWESNDPDDIRVLFTEDAEYRTNPWTDPFRGHDAIVDAWIERRDEPGTFTFEGDVVGVDGDLVFYEAVTRYASSTDYSNLWVIRLTDDGRARQFTEWWMDRSESA